MKLKLGVGNLGRIGRLMLWLAWGGISFPAAAGVTLLEPPILEVDANKAATGAIRLRADTATSVKLRVGSPVGAISSNVLASQITVATNRPGMVATFFLKQNESTALPIAITNYSATEAARFELFTNGVFFAAGWIKPAKAPFTVTVDNPPTALPEIKFVDGNPGALSLRNADSQPYRVRWELEINNELFTNGMVDLPSQGTAKVNINHPPAPDFCHNVCGFAKDAMMDGRVTLRWDSGFTNGIAGRLEKGFPIRLRLHNDSDCHKFLGYLVIVGLLALGGFFSLLANNGVPNLLRRIDLNEELQVLRRRVRNLTFQLDSGLRVQVGMECRRLHEILTKHILFNPELANMFTVVGNGIKALSRLLDLLEKMAALLDRMDDDSGLYPPTLVARFHQKLKEATNLLRGSLPSEANLQNAETRILEAGLIMDSLGKADEAFASSLASRGSRLDDAFDDKLRAKLAGYPDIDQTILDVLPAKPAPAPAAGANPVAGANPAPAKPAAKTAVITPDQYARRDSQLVRLEMILEFLNLPDSLLQSDQAKRVRDEWLAAINNNGWESIQRAHRLLEQLQNGLFLENAETQNALRTAASIFVGQSVVVMVEPVQFGIQFQNARYQSQLVRELVSCEWDFGDGLKEPGWNVTHYFARAGEYDVKVRFITKSGMVLEGPQRRLSVARHRGRDLQIDRSYVEFLRFGIAMMVALLALVSGAQEKIAQLDAVAGIIAVVVMGFGADTVKNILTQKTK